MPTGGDVLEISWNHPTLGSGKVNPKAGEDSTLDLGGFRAADDKQMLDGGGNMINQLTQGRWECEVTGAFDTNTDLTLEKCIAIAESPQLATFQISHINGSVYSGKGTIVGDISGNWNQSTFKFKASGGGRLKKIV